MVIEISNIQNYRWKRILLIKPNYRTKGWDYYNMNFPPINLTYIASYLTDLDIEVKILDAKVKNLSYKQIRKKIFLFKPDLVGITVFVAAAINVCNNIAKIVKKVNPNCTIVFGNQHPTHYPDETLRVDEVDIVVRGEGELTFRELIINGSPENILGVSYKSNGKLIHNPDRPLMSKKEYENIRYPARHLTKNNKYSIFTVRLETVETSRGCPFTCKFCTTHIFNKQQWRSRPFRKIITELKAISNNKKITDIFFVDDNLTTNVERIEKLCERIIECKKNKEINDFKFFAQIRVDDIVQAPQMVRKMAGAGFWIICVGIESLHEETLKDMKKALTFNKTLKALKILHENNIIIIGNLIIGYNLNATEEDIIKDIKFAKKLNIDIVDFKILTPFPGTEIRKELEVKNLILSNDWSKYIFITPVIKTYKLSPKKLHALLNYSYREHKDLYNWKGTVSRIIKTRGLFFLLNPIRIIFWIKTLYTIKTIKNTFFETK